MVNATVIRRTLLVGAAAMLTWGCGESTVNGTGVNGGSTGGGAVDQDGDGLISQEEAPTITRQEYEQYLTQATEHSKQQDSIQAPWSQLLTREDTADITVGADTLTMPAGAAARYDVGDILISANIEDDKVFLRRITGSSEQAGQVVFATEPAAITDVVLKGSVTEMPTAANPYEISGDTRTMGQQLGLGDVFPSINVLGGNSNETWGISEGAPSGFSGQIKLDVAGPSLDAPNANLDLDAKISSSWLRNIVGHSATVRVGATNGGAPPYSTRTSCSSVIHALEFIKGNNGDQRECKQAYETWINSSAYPSHVPANFTNDNIQAYWVDGVPRLRCRDTVDFWFDDWVWMPHPEEVDWARNECSGVLEEFDLDARFDPTFGLQKAHVNFQGSYSRETLPRDIIKQRDELLSKDTWKVFFIGWFPVALRFEGKIIANFYKVNATGNVTFGFDNIEAGLDASLGLTYNGGPLDQQSSWTMRGDIDPILGGDWHFEGTAHGSVEREFVGIEGGVYLYDLLGPYLIPADLYGRLDVAAGFGTTNRQLCHFGISGGVKGEAGIKGRVPFTSYEANWKLWEYDSCGGGDRTSALWYQDEGSFCLKHCVNAVPLTVKLEWDQVTDLDLKVISPSGQEISYSTNEDGAYFDNSSGCFRSRCDEGATNNELASWGSAPEEGTYRVIVTNDDGNAASSFTVNVTAQNDQGENYIEETFNGSVDASRDAEETFEFEYAHP